jgi:CRISPR-associated protein Cmr2
MRLMILSQSIATPRKEEARSGMRRDPGGYSYWLKNRSSVFLRKRLDEMNAINLLVSDTAVPPSINDFPYGSWALNVPFTLIKPYISQEDTDFYIVDNPVKKEWVFKVPYIAPSQWKGALRSAMMQELVSDLRDKKINEEKFIEERIRLYRLFGNEKDGTSDFLNRVHAHYSLISSPKEGQSEQKLQEILNSKLKDIEEAFKSELISKGFKQGDIKGFQGNLHFYPTYFDQIGLEIINPHDRKTGAGKNPIYIECVPEGTNGKFSLLFVPLTGVEELSDSEAKKDFGAVARGVRAMMTCYGIGAKTSSSFGIAEIGSVAATIKPEKFQKHWLTAWEESA